MVQMLPANAMIIPLYVVLASYHEVNQLSGLVITYLTFVLPFAIWTLRGFILGIPRISRRRRWSTATAARARSSRSCSRSSRPGLVATSIFAFIQAWNEFIFAYILLATSRSRR